MTLSFSVVGTCLVGQRLPLVRSFGFDLDFEMAFLTVFVVILRLILALVISHK